MNERERILITGGAGFIGSTLAAKLAEEGATVTAVDNLTTGRLGNIRQLVETRQINFVKMDIRNERNFDMLTAGFDAIIHLAAVVGVRRVLENPLKTIKNNIHSTETVLNAAYKNGCKVFLASSSEVYGCRNEMPLKESMELIAGDPSVLRWSYAISKITDEVLANSYKQLGLQVICGRFFNIIGPRQSPAYGMVVPRFINQSLRNQPLTVYGNGNQSRCFCDVNDACDAVIKLMNCPEAYGKAINIGSEVEISILELALIIKEQTGSNSEIEFIPEKNVGKGFKEIMRRKPDLELIRSLIDWESALTLTNTLEMIIRRCKSKMEYRREHAPQ